LLNLCKTEEFDNPLINEMKESLIARPTDAVDVQDELLACCQDDVDRTIVEMRVAGYTGQDIGEVIDMSAKNVHRRRKILEGRLKGRLDRCH
jgi:hypothetical protein